MLELTYELKILCRGIPKDTLIEWLIGHNIDTFVEGVVDDLDIDHEYNLPMTPKYSEVGGDDSPLSIFKFELEWLEEVKDNLNETFGEKIICEIHQSKTHEWVEGWKKNFTPIETEKFLIVPPWDKDIQTDRKKLVIEPGLAFGTGHHATTLLCLQLLERFKFKISDSVLDVGTGTGILAIACSKLGVEKIFATDIDPDALIAAKYNIEMNLVETILLENTDVPQGREFAMVVANILAVVLKKILPTLAIATAKGGHLILSGLLTEDAQDMIAEAENLGFKFDIEQSLDCWSALLFCKIA